MLQTFTNEHIQATGVKRLTLLVHHVVVVEQVLTHVEVPRFDLLLGAFDNPGQHAVFDRFAFFHTDAVPPLGNAIGFEDAQQVVFER